LISTQENIRALAKAKAVKPEDIALILDRPRHADLIAAVRKAGASVRLITDGDVAGVIHTADPVSTGIDIYFGIGGAPEGVLAAATLACIGGRCRKKARPRRQKWASRIRARNISWRTW
jgi:fructose-1,6-bisphosphatase II / sedoheptulose-1,7-bisphosphatase